MSERRISVALAIGLVGLIGAFYLGTIRTGHSWGDDHCAYLHHAKNLLQGTRYGDIGYVQNPSSLNPKMYPPIFPMLLVPLYAYSGLNLAPMKVAETGFLLTALVLLYFLLRQGGNDRLALAAVGIVGFSPYFWDFKDNVLSEFPFIAFSYAALLLTEHWIRHRGSRTTEVLLGAATGLVACLAYGTRSVGLILLPVVLLFGFLRVRKLTWFAAALLVVFLLGAAAQQTLFGLESGYADSYRRTVTLRSLLGSPVYYSGCFAVLWDNGYSRPAQLVLAWVVGLLALYGGWIRLRATPSAADWFGLLYFLFIILFPWGGKRYLIPVMPIYVFWALTGIVRLGRWALAPAPLAPLAGLAAAVLLTFGAKYATTNWREVAECAQGPDLERLIEYLRREAGPAGLVVFQKARFLALYAETRATEAYAPEHAAQALDYYHRSGVTHVVVSKVFHDGEEESLDRLVQEQAAAFERVFEDGRFAVFRLRHGVHGQTGKQSAACVHLARRAARHVT